MSNSQTSFRTCQGTAKYIALTLLLALPANAQVSEQANPAQADELPIALEVFNGPKPKNLDPPRYPRNEAVLGHEGWVHLRLMVDPQGNPYEVVVSKSSGNEAFEKAAMKGAQALTFEPATIAGKPIHAAYEYKAFFDVTDADGARKPFVRRYRDLSKAIAAGDRQRADEDFAKLKVQNLYEEAYYNLAKYSYCRKWGNESQQLAALRLAIAEERYARFLPKQLFVTALQALLPLELKGKNFADAMKTWEKLKSNDVDAAFIAAWQEIIDDIVLLRKDDRSYSVPGRMGKGSSWFYGLFKSRFRLVVSNGRVSEIKLRCDKQYVLFRYEPDIQYRVAEKFGECGMQLIGEPGTTFELIQS
mgnify:CR=1 FL=1